MKAWNVTDKNGDTGISQIVFAETRGKAIQIALACSDGAYDYYEFTDMRALREPVFDAYANGRSYLEWSNDEDRVLMVKLGGFYCSPECYMTYEECLQCPAHEWCSAFEGMEDDGK